jgi:hypothetical protein
MTAPNITFSGGTTINGGVTVKAAPYILKFYKEQVVDWTNISVLTVNGFIQPDGFGNPVVLLALNQEQQNYINALSGPPTNYVLFEGNWGFGSTDHSPNTACVLFPVESDWQYATITPLGSFSFNEYSTYIGTWNFPFSALTLVDWG